MSAAKVSQVVDPKEFIPICDYDFLGDEVTVAKKRAFINQLREKATVYHAALVSRISRKTAYQWYQRDQQFAEAWEDAVEDAVDVMETSVYERALAGDNLLSMFWLKRYRPQFRDKVQVDIQVINEEIQERMRQVGMDRLPLPQLVGQMEESMQFPTLPDNQQKELAAGPSSQSSSSAPIIIIATSTTDE